MFYDLNNFEYLLEESASLFDCYFERVFESETVDDLLSASHWYSNAIYTLMIKPDHQSR